MPHVVKLARLAWLCLLCNSLCIHSQVLNGAPELKSWNPALEKFFGSIDKDGDGQIEASEAKQYIDANFGESDIHVDASNAAQQMSRNLDGSDSDATISKEEVEGHLRRLLKVLSICQLCNCCYDTHPSSAKYSVLSKHTQINSFYVRTFRNLCLFSQSHYGSLSATKSSNEST